MGIETPKIEVRYQNLSIEGDVYVGSRALPTLLNATLNTIEVVFSFYLFIYLLFPSNLCFAVQRIGEENRDH